MKNNILIFMLLSFASLFTLSSFLMKPAKEKLYNLNSLKNKQNIISLAVLGSGPAGLSAGIYGARAGIHTVVFAGPNPGGQLRESMLVENWPGVNKDSGANIMSNLEKQAKDLGAIIVNKPIYKVDLSTWPFKIDDYWALSVVIATGATPRRLGVANEDKYWVKGILSCPLCDSHLIKNKNTVVIGGDDSAVERILQLAPYAKEVILILSNNKMQTIYDMYKKIRDFPHVKILFNKDIKSFEGDGKRLTGINVIDTKTGEKSCIKTKWVFLSIGFQPNSGLFKNYLDLDPEGYIQHDNLTQETKVKGVYVAGNVSDPIYKQAITAAGDGTKAATSAMKFLSDLPTNKETKTLIKQNSYKHNQEKVIKINSINSLDQFENIVKSEKKIFIEFYSPLCSACKSMKNIIGSLAYKYQEHVKFYKIDILKNKPIAKKYEVSLIPEFLLFKDSKLIDRKAELLDYDQISDLINSAFDIKK